MPEILKASEQNLNAVFSDAYLFYIPVYQRPYAWSTEHVDELLDDLLDAMRRDSTSPYFLGSIVLVKNEGNSQSDVVDGQQRLTTLSMLFCVLRELAVGDTSGARRVRPRSRQRPPRNTGPIPSKSKIPRQRVLPR